MNIVRRIVGKVCHIFHSSIAKCLTSQGRVLMLHWVGNEKQDDESEPFRITIDQFRVLLQWLKSRNIIHLENWEQEKDFFALTIDDVPENFYRNAYPLLKEASIPFTLFVNVSLLNKEGYISEEQLKEIAKCELCTIGSHGVLHGEFNSLNTQQALQDLRDSRKELEAIIAKPISMYAYPYGSYYACGYTKKCLAGKVYKYAFGTVSCPITKPSLLKNYFLPRINVDIEFINSLK